MPVDSGAYADVTDLHKGDIPLPTYIGDGSSYINAAAEEIDSQIGHLYVTPVVIGDEPANRPSKLMLKRINWLIASGRLILDLAIAGESQTQHAYGMGMLKEGLALLKKIVNGEIILNAVKIEGDEGDFTGPAIYNEDSESLVQAFYDRRNPYQVSPYAPYSPLPPEPYGNNHKTVEVLES